MKEEHELRRREREENQKQEEEQKQGVMTKKTTPIQVDESEQPQLKKRMKRCTIGSFLSRLRN